MKGKNSLIQHKKINKRLTVFKKSVIKIIFMLWFKL